MEWIKPDTDTLGLERDRQKKNGQRDIPQIIRLGMIINDRGYKERNAQDPDQRHDIGDI